MEQSVLTIITEDMIDLLLILVVPALLILFPPIWQIVFVIRKLVNKTRITIGTGFVIALGMEIFFSMAAFFISMYGIGYEADGASCVIGSLLFMYVGTAIAIFALPAIGLFGFAFSYLRKRTQSQ
jgi:hypothetical protein